MHTRPAIKSILGDELIIEKSKRGRCGNCAEFDPRPGHDLGAETGYCLEYRIHVFRQNPCETDSGFKPENPEVKPCEKHKS